MRLINDTAWAIGSRTKRKAFRVRRVVWGRLLARAERRDDEVIVRVKLTPLDAHTRVLGWTPHAQPEAR